ncbi:hypothetical protein BRADI_2g33055v3 [Brachypodium distachyon]|uniref:Uncharacterized protein n=1 Tax=Brachypodium distachyon TaxID=15368 RepID=A0A0Q3K8A9_BRADI|nr:hypothetical protein BRADI_2g33055v3 [Brachypodium distachyon]KQK07097.1 hypothetical protein BRADI_2g33055v3 [Brachypodium distachyon]KQK07098.1 hypothetical protein BRADI_2g33055v3 [Brachypodium distachyon]KQK07099.1 hypothetical protein BRADI_2g33055v3 [Brachypodium distachyon]
MGNRASIFVGWRKGDIRRCDHTHHFLVDLAPWIKVLALDSVNEPTAGHQATAGVVTRDVESNKGLVSRKVNYGVLFEDVPEAGFSRMPPLLR